jgi:uncharacterized RDD family membrane protein YckC
MSDGQSVPGQPSPAGSPPPTTPPVTHPPAATPTSAATDHDLAALLAQIIDGEVPSAPAVGAPLTRSTDVERPEKARVAQIESEGGIDFDPTLASFGGRLGGLLVDTVVVVLCLLPGLALVLTGSTALALLGVLAMIVGFGTTVVLYARAVSTTGQWIGNRVSGTRVVDVRTGRMVSGGEAGLRFVVRQLVSPILLVGFLVALGNSQRRTFHDTIAGTVVTRPPRVTWSIDDEVPGG